MTYDFRHFSERIKDKPLELTDEQVAAIVEENPRLAKEDIHEVIDAINWQAISDPIGVVRKSRDGEVLAVRIPNKNHPWEAIWLNGRGGGYSIENPHQWKLLEQLGDSQFAVRLAKGARWEDEGGEPDDEELTRAIGLVIEMLNNMGYLVDINRRD